MKGQPFMEMKYDRKTALMILAALPGLGPVGLRKLDRILDGKAPALLNLPENAWKTYCHGRVRRELENWRHYFPVERVFETLAEMGADFVTSEEPGYPEGLKPFADRPVGLYRYRAGKKIPARTVGIVGTRVPSSYGRKVARDLAESLCRRGFCIVSGLAEGIDTEAHRAALQSGGLTTAVLGGGLKCCYPKSNHDLMEAIKDSGGVWTEFPLWRRADRRSFPQRNRIVAGVAEAVVVVESGLKGGSLITARMASEQGKSVYIVPGRIDAPESAGCHALIRDGAQLITSADDILEDLNCCPRSLHPLNQGGKCRSITPRGEEPQLEGLQADIWNYLKGHEPAHMDAIADATGNRIGKISGTILEMEIHGLLCRRLDGRYERS